MGDLQAPSRQAQRETTRAGPHIEHCLNARKPALDLALKMRLVNHVIQKDLLPPSFLGRLLRETPEPLGNVLRIGHY